MLRVKRLGKVFLVAMLSCFMFVGCGSGVSLEMPPFELLTTDTNEDEVISLMGKDYDYNYYHVGDKDYGLTYDSRTYTYEIEQKIGGTLRANFTVDSEVDRLDHAVFSIYQDHDSYHPVEFEEVEKYSQYVQDYYTELFGEPEVETGEEYTEYTWYTEDGCEIRLEDGKKYTSSYNLEIWWNNAISSYMENAF